MLSYEGSLGGDEQWLMIFFLTRSIFIGRGSLSTRKTSHQAVQVVSTSPGFSRNLQLSMKSNSHWVSTVLFLMQNRFWILKSYHTIFFQTRTESDHATPLFPKHLRYSCYPNPLQVSPWLAACQPPWTSYDSTSGATEKTWQRWGWTSTLSHHCVGWYLICFPQIGDLCRLSTKVI